jgi:hypothetical protein
LVAASPLPEAPNLISKVTELSDRRKIALEWTASAQTESPITGYILQMAPFGSTNFTSIFEGKNKPALRTFEHLVTTGERYTYRVLAVNFNGRSAPSNEFTFNACVAPVEIPPPFRISELSETNRLVVGIEQPNDNGGCPVTGF